MKSLIIIPLLYSPLIVNAQKEDKVGWIISDADAIKHGVDTAILKSFPDSGTTDKNGYRIGTWTLYRGSGSMVTIQGTPNPMAGKFDFIIKSTGTYKNGRKEGEWISYKSEDPRSPSGWRLHMKENFLMDQFHGKLERYNGKLIPYTEEYYEFGKPSGLFKYYFSNGDLQMSRVYEDGKLTGEEISYYKSGQIKYKLSNKENRRHGEYTSYFTDGILEQNSWWVDGVQHGEYKIQYENGQLQEVGYYNDGKRDGTVKQYHENGTLKVEKEYRSDRLWKINKYQSSEGLPLDKGNFNRGSGTLNIYDASNKLIEKEVYSNGKVFKRLKP